MRIAIADDHVDVRHFLQGILAQAEYSSSQFTNGRDLITALQRETFDLLIVDWNMPLQSGIEVIFWAHANLVPCPPTIVMTSRSNVSRWSAVIKSLPFVNCELEYSACPNTH